MSRTCTICAHSQRHEIDEVLLAGRGLRDIADRFSVSKSALFRHKNAHIPATLAKAQDAAEAARAEDLLGQLAYLQAEAHRIGAKAEASGDLRTALSGIRELVRIIELMAKLRGELQEGQTINVLVLPEWLTIRSVLMESLAAYPQARIDVAGALERIGHADR